MKLAFAVVLPLILGGCATGAGNLALEPKLAASKYAAGEVNISTFDPIPWYTVADSLKPKFDVKNAGELLDDVAPVVGGDDYRSSRRTSFSLQAQLAGPVVDNTATDASNSATDASGNTVTTSSSQTNATTTKATPDTVTAQPATLTSQIGTPGPLTDYSFDPDLKYRAATALFQNIQLLDRYLDQAPGPKGSTAYLLRSQITVNPYAHSEPYDVYARLQLELNTDTLATDSRLDEAVETAFKLPRTDKGFKSIRDSAVNTARSVLNNARFELKLYPLIISDNLERIDTRRIAEQLQSIQLGLSARAGAASGGAGFNSALDRLRSLVGSDLNSLVTYSQPDDRAMLVRFGAAFDADSGYSMRARTYDVLFVIVSNDAQIMSEICRDPVLKELNAQLSANKSDDCTSQKALLRQLTVYLDSYLRDARTGEKLPPIAESDLRPIRRKIADLLDYYGEPAHQTPWAKTVCNGLSIDRKYDKATIDEFLYRAVLTTDGGSAWDCAYDIDRLNSDLASDLKRARAARNYVSASIALPDSKTVPPDAQYAIFSDDGKASQVRMVQPELGDPNLFKATLYLADGGIELASTGNSYDGTNLTWQFPSLAAVGRDISKSQDAAKLIVRVRTACAAQASACEYNAMDSDNRRGYSLLVQKSSAKPARTPSYTVTTFANAFNKANTGVPGAYLTVIVDPLKPKEPAPDDIAAYRLRLEGATLKELDRLNESGAVVTDGKPVSDASKNAATFTTIGSAFRVVLDGEQLAAGSKVKIVVEALDKDKKVIDAETPAAIEIQQPGQTASDTQDQTHKP